MHKYLSEKIKLLSFLLILMVVFLHSYNINLQKSGGISNNEIGIGFFLQDIISQGITRIAVPLFFAISGYLFFLNIQGSVNEFVAKLKSRVRTLVVPFLFWSIWGLLLFFILQSLPGVSKFFNRDLISHYSLSKILYTIILNPIPYQLWFIRDLMLLVVLSPAIYMLIKYVRFFSVVAFLVAWLLKVDFLIFSNESILFFVLGAYISLFKKELLLRKFSSKEYLAYSAIWFILLFTKSWLVYTGSANQKLIFALYKSGIIIGLLAIWTSYDVFIDKKKSINPILIKLPATSFFIYAFHEPILTMLKKAIFALMGTGDLESLLIYFICPIVTILISLICAYILKRISPKFYGIITGGR